MNDEQRKVLDELLSSIESDIISAGEECPVNYQSGFDWSAYNKMLAGVKLRVREFASSQLPGSPTAVEIRLPEPYDVVTILRSGEPACYVVSATPMKLTTNPKDRP